MYVLKNIAICIVAYNRLASVSRLVQSLLRASYPQKVDLIFSIDKSNSRDVACFAEAVDWVYGEKKIVEHSQNLGLRKHILGLGQYFSTYEALIVLEDDVVVSPNFVIYATQCIDKYKDDDRIAGISLYNFNVNYQTKLPFIPLKDENDVYFMNCAQSWGQVWMKKQWNDFYEWYKRNQEEFTNLQHLPEALNKWPKSSWLKYHTRYCIEQNKYFVYPYVALSTNNSDAGTHVAVKNTLFQCRLSYFPVAKYKLPSLDESTVLYDGFFENKKLFRYLDVCSEEITVDLYGSKRFLNTRYLLSMNVLNYKIVKSFGLNFKPIELNIYTNNEGKEIYLYDTATGCNNKNRKDLLKIYEYFFEIGTFRLLKNIGFKSLVKAAIIKILKR